jgi:hypothetical protein
MIPEHYHSQARYFQLIHKRDRTPEENAWLTAEDARLAAESKRHIQKMFAQIAAMERHRKRTKGLNKGEYAAAA